MAKVIMQFSNIRSWNTTFVCYTEKRFKFQVTFNIYNIKHINTPKTHEHTQSNKMTGAAKQNNQHKPNQTVLNLKKKNPIVNKPKIHALSLSLRFISRFFVLHKHDKNRFTNPATFLSNGWSLNQGAKEKKISNKTMVAFIK